MSTRVLKKKPLIEAIMEIRWALQQNAQNMSTDPHYRILVGRFYDRTQKEYPEHEPLPISQMPDELVGHAVQHRFRCAKNDWPLIQLGPGIMTVNDTSKYVWSDFRNRAIDSIAKLYESYPKPEELTVERILLRYIDAIEVDYDKENIFAFLKEKMKINVELPTGLFPEGVVESRPKVLNWQSAFSCREPVGNIILRLTLGKREDKPSLIWETLVQSSSNEVPTMPTGFDSWIDKAHQITHDWFFELIQGDLERRFDGGE